MSERPRKSWTRSVVSVLIIFCLGWVVYIAGLNLIAWHFARNIGRSHANLGVIATLLPDTSIAELDGPRIEKFGISFLVPWKSLAVESNLKSTSTVNFRESIGLVIFDPRSQPDGATLMQGTTPRQQTIMNGVFGARTLSSNYQLMAAEVAATPADVKWWASRAENLRAGILLMNKSLNLGDGDAIYKINSGTQQGFQYGNPAVAPYLVKLDLFDGSDWQYRLWIVGKDKKQAVITQAQINGLVASFRGLSGRR